MPSLDSTDLENIRAIVASALAAPKQTDRILTPAEAIVYTKHKTERGFRRWCTKYFVHPAEKRRYSRDRLDWALQREADKRGLKRGAVRRPKGSPGGNVP